MLLKILPVTLASLALAVPAALTPANEKFVHATIDKCGTGVYGQVCYNSMEECKWKSSYAYDFNSERTCKRRYVTDCTAYLTELHGHTIKSQCNKEGIVERVNYGQIGCCSTPM